MKITVKTSGKILRKNLFFSGNNSQSNLALVHQRGFTTPLALMLGTVLTLISTTLVFRSHENNTNAIVQKATAQSLSLAESGITQTTSKLINFPVLVEQNLADWPTTTTDLTSSSSGCGSSGSSVSASTADINWVIAAKKMADGDTSNEDQAWIDLNAGQYRVLDYQVSNDEATLKIEGVDKDTISTTILHVTFPIVSGPTTSIDAGLWAYNFESGGPTGDGGLKVNVNDSSQCYDSDNDGNPGPAKGTDFTKTSKLLPLNDPPFADAPLATATTTTTGFPSLPNNGTYQAPTSGNFNHLPNCLVLDSGTSMTFPRNGDVDTNGNVYGSASPPPDDATYIYRLGTNTQEPDDGCQSEVSEFQNTQPAFSFLHSGDGNMTWGVSGQETIKIYSDGAASFEGGGIVGPATVGANTTKVIWYINGNLNFSGDGGTFNPKYFQFYLYGERDFVLSGSGQPVGFVFGPQTRAQLLGDADLVGALWVKSYTQQGGGNLVQKLTGSDFSELEVAASSVTSRISPPSSWQRRTKI